MADGLRPGLGLLGGSSTFCLLLQRPPFMLPGGTGAHVQGSCWLWHHLGKGSFPHSEARQAGRGTGIM